KAAYIEKLNREHGCICIDMESFALFHNAALNGKRAATLLTISDTLKGEKQSISSADRELALTLSSFCPASQSSCSFSLTAVTLRLVQK
ncbi:phosphorylase family protein, partial [Bittarella massiliensis (ex Durand et al. 2017)]|nr:hypothetical protein [Bittarella massiliensis (ex Durand et al. 2017)]